MPSSCSKGVRKQQLTALAQPTKPEQRGKLLPKVLDEWRQRGLAVR